jgi:virginiamycin B lyase
MDLLSRFMTEDELGVDVTPLILPRTRRHCAVSGEPARERVLRARPCRRGRACDPAWRREDLAGTLSQRHGASLAKPWLCMRLVLTTAVLLAVVAPSAGAAVYWAASWEDAIGRANPNGTGATRGFIHAGFPMGVAVTSTHVYWATNGNPSTIARARLDGTGVDPDFIAIASRPTGLAVTSTHIYWGQLGGTNDGRIGRAKLDGSDVTPDLIAGVPDPCGVAVDGTYVYWGNSGSATVGRAKLDGSEPDQDFISTGGNVGTCGVAANATHIFWGNYWMSGTTIGRAEIGGTGVDNSFVEGAFWPSAVAVDDTHLYWTNEFGPGGTLGSIGRAALDGSGVSQSFVAGIDRPRGVAVDALRESTVTVEASDPAITYGEQVDFTAEVATMGPAATGTIDFAVNGTSVESVLLNGIDGAVFRPPFLLDVADEVSASYSGDGTYMSGGPRPAQLTIVPAATTTTIASSPNPVPTGGSFDLAVRVENSDTSITPFGSVEIRVDAVPVDLPFALEDDGTVLLGVLADVPPGTYVISAHYRDDTASIPDFLDSSASTTQTILGAAPPPPGPPAAPPAPPAPPPPSSPEAALKSELIAMNARLARRVKARGAAALTASQQLVAPAAGTLSQKVTARAKRRTIVVARGSHARTSAGKFKLRLRLTSDGRRLLVRSRKLHLNITSAFAQPDRAPVRAATRVTLRRAHVSLFG